MRLWYGFVGALLGAVFGGAATFLIVAATMSNDDFVAVFAIITFGPVGLLVGAALGVATSLWTFNHVHGTRQTEWTPRKKTQVVVGLLLSVPVLTIGMIWGSIRLNDPPSDQQLLNNFWQHRATFDQLVKMIHTDKGVTKIDDASMGSINVVAPGISPARISLYRRLMTSVGITRGFEATPQADDIEFLVFASGSAISSEENKGYIYLTKPPGRLLKSLDQRPPEGEDNAQLYRHIEGNWYLYYQYLPG